MDDTTTANNGYNSVFPLNKPKKYNFKSAGFLNWKILLGFPKPFRAKRTVKQIIHETVAHILTSVSMTGNKNKILRTLRQFYFIFRTF